MLYEIESDRMRERASLTAGMEQLRELYSRRDQLAQAIEALEAVQRLRSRRRQTLSGSFLAGEATEGASPLHSYLTLCRESDSGRGADSNNPFAIQRRCGAPPVNSLTTCFAFGDF